jgi:hypothetical protein
MSTRKWSEFGFEFAFEFEWARAVGNFEVEGFERLVSEEGLSPLSTMSI